MDENPKVLELAKCFEDAGNLQDPMESSLPLHRAQELQKQMSAGDFYAGLKLAALQSVASGKIQMVYEIANIEPKICQDAEVKQAVNKFLQEAESRGMEPDQELKTLFGQ